jgi:hypothetical protein
MKIGICLLSLLFLSRMALAQTLDASKTPTDYYESALQAYLSGDFDQAILLDSKALQNNSQDKKAQALLSILISEKDTANKTVIWIGGQPAVIEKPKAPEVQAPITVFQQKTIREGTYRPAFVDNKRLAELETRVQTVAFLMERDAFNAQNETNKSLTDISLNLKGLSKDLNYGLLHSNLLFLLALILSLVALWKSWKNGQDLKKQKTFLDHPASLDEQEKIVNIRRM